MDIKNIYVYKIGFGDCSLLELDNVNILLDCGGNIKELEKNVLVNDIISKTLNKNLECIVTHFHDDHYNTLSMFPNAAFDAIYAPNFFTKEEIKLQLYALLILSNSSSCYLMAEQMLRFIPKIIDDGILKECAIVNFVKKGDLINNNMEVLWPDPNILDYEVRNLLDEFEKILKVNSNEIYRESANFHNGVWSDLIEKIELLAKKYISNVEMLKNNRMQNEITLDYISNNIKNILDDLNAIKKQVNLKKLTSVPRKRIKQIQNKYSIIFHNDKVLFLGDITAKIFNDNIACKIENNKYNYIKVAHHGTKNYFTNKLPKSDKMIISSGKKSNCDISAMYPLYYNDRKFICTCNDFCEYYNSISKFGEHEVKDEPKCKIYCGMKNICEKLNF